MPGGVNNPLITSQISTSQQFKPQLAMEKAKSSSPDRRGKQSHYILQPLKDGPTITEEDEFSRMGSNHPNKGIKNRIGTAGADSSQFDDEQTLNPLKIKKKKGMGILQGDTQQEGGLKSHTHKFINRGESVIMKNEL